MEFRKISVVFGILFILISGTAFAIRGATTTKVMDLARWTAVGTAESEVTEGGNITIVDLDVDSLTDRWAGFYGNLSGTMYLTDNNSLTSRYLFTWPNASADLQNGIVCVSLNSSYAFATAQMAQGIDIDFSWGFLGQPDSASNTFTVVDCNITFQEQGYSVPTTSRAIHQGNSTFSTCTMFHGAMGYPKSDFAFCVNGTQPTSVGRNYRNEPVNYEIIVPTTYGPNQSDTYYFYAELS